MKEEQYQTVHNENGWLPLHRALNNKCFTWINQTITPRQSISHTLYKVSDRSGVSPLHLACRADHVDGNEDTIVGATRR